jgi:hypothetical protein
VEWRAVRTGYREERNGLRHLIRKPGKKGTAAGQERTESDVRLFMKKFAGFLLSPSEFDRHQVAEQCGEQCAFLLQIVFCIRR